MSLDSFIRLSLHGILVNVGLVFLDGVWISALSRLGISYGGGRSTLALFIFLRGIIFGLWWVILVGIAVLRIGVSPRFAIGLLLGINILILGLGLYGSYIEPTHLSVSHLEMQVPGLRRPIRIVQLSDMHVTLTTRRDLAIPGLVESLQPDLIVMTGDYSNGHYTELPKIVSQLHAPLGIFAVNGNVETPLEMQSILMFLNEETPSRPYGISLLDSIGSLLDGRAQLNSDVMKGVHRWANPIPIMETTKPKANCTELKKTLEERDVDDHSAYGNALHNCELLERHRTDIRHLLCEEHNG